MTPRTWISAALSVCALGCKPSSTTPARPIDAPQAAAVADGRKYTKPSMEELEKKLTRIQLEVTQHEGTEPPFRNAYWDNHAAGIYVDVVTGEPLFSSLDKFESGTGWPSFSRPIEEGRVVSKTDSTFGMERTEVRSRAGDSHLGHVFDDGPPPTGLRFCINSAALRFVPTDRLAAEGYGAYAKRFQGAAEPVASATNNACAMPPPGEKPGCEATMETAVLEGAPELKGARGAAASLREVPGVLEAEPEPPGARVRVVYDAKKIALPDLMDRWVALGGKRGAP